MTRGVVALVAVVALTAGAWGQWSDPYDAYQPGPLCPDPTTCPVNSGIIYNGLAAGGWDAWQQAWGVSGVVSTAHARSAPNSVEITNNRDCIFPFVINNGTNPAIPYPTSGVWRLEAWLWLDSATFSSDQYFIVNDMYSHTGTIQWTVQLHFVAGTGMVQDDFRAGTPQPIVLDQWAKVQVDIDLNSDCIIQYYNGAEVARGTYTRSPTSQLAIANLDLYAPAGMSLAYWDDVSLTQLSVSGLDYQVNQPGASLDIDGATSNSCAPLAVTKFAGQPGTFNITSTNVGAGWDVALTTPETSVPASAGGFVTPGGQIVNVDFAAPSLSFLYNLTFAVPFANASIPFSFPTAFNLTAQAVILDPAQADTFSLSAPNDLTVTPQPCIMVEAVGSNSFNSNTASGFFRIHHYGLCLDIVDVVFDWVASSNPAQATMEFDTDQVGMSDAFIYGNGTTAGCTGTYRNGSDVVCGLIYDALNTYNGYGGCGGNCGFIATNQVNTTPDYKTLQFRFTSPLFLGASPTAPTTFEADIDTDLGAGISGGAMAGMVVTITLSDTTVYTGELAADPNNPSRSYIEFF